MAGAIVSANVGGAVAGQVVIPEPVGPSSATSPDFLNVTANDLLELFRQRQELRSQERIEEIRAAPAPSRGNGFTGTLLSGTLFGVPVLILIGMAFFLIKGRAF